MKTRFLAAAALTAGLAMGTLSACGSDSIPSDAVVRVGDLTIKHTTFDHWMKVAAAGTQQPVGVPPEFTACVALRRRTAPKPAKGQPTPTDEQLRTQCKAAYDDQRKQVLGFLINTEWYFGEAARLGLKITDAEVATQYRADRKQQFPTDADFQTFIKQSGMTMRDIVMRVRRDIAEQKLQQHASGGTPKVTPAAVAAYYAHNRTRFSQPERRDLRIVLTKTQARAAAARRALAGGESWKAVTARFSIDAASKAQGGAMLGVSKGTQEKAFDDAIFAAHRGRLGGPIKTQFGYYVFVVTMITPPSSQSLAQARPTITQVLTSEQQQKVLTAYSKKFEKHWTSITHCRSGYVMQFCANAPKPKK